MQRLVYSPKATVLVKGADNKIRDISHYVTKGQVNRKLNQVSTASITLRNPDRIFTDRASIVFRPMDPITIFLTRLQNRPIRVFTGFLDSAPLLSLFPGEVTLTASCTLKKIMHTYWDPALLHTQQWLQEPGRDWLPNVDGGGIKHITGNSAVDNPDNAKKDVDSKGKEKAEEKPKDAVADPSIGKLLHDLLIDVGGWREGNIYIEAIPENLATRIAAIFENLNKENSPQIKSAIEDLMKDLIGTSSLGGGGSNGADSGSGTGPDAKVGPGILSPLEVAKVAQAAGFKGADLVKAVAVALCESGSGGGSDPKAKNASGASGLFQTMPEHWRGKGINPFDPNANARLAYKIFKNRGSWADWAASAGCHASKMGTARAAVDKLRGATASSADQTNRDKSSSARASSFDREGAGSQVVFAATVGDDKDKTSTDSSATDKAGTTPDEPKIFRPIAGQVSIGRGWHESSKGVKGLTNTSGSVHWHSGLDVSCSAGTPCVAPADGEITMATLNWSDGGMIHFRFTEDVGQIKKGTIIGWGHVRDIKGHKAGDKVKAGQTIAGSGAPGGGPHVHFVQLAHEGGGGDGQVDPKPLFTALNKGETSATAGGDDPGTGAGGGAGGGASLEDVMTVSKATFFASQLEWPSLEDTVEAQFLMGNKSAMNDKSLLPFVEQMCSASLRNFQSMPNGNFYAFYPDYFGEMGYRTPYWAIDDIEILDGGIQLNDDSLVTHMYVTGSTIGADFQVNFLERIASTGVVTIFEAFRPGGLLNREEGEFSQTPAKDPKDKDKEDGKGKAKASANSKKDPVKEDPKDKDKEKPDPEHEEGVRFLQRYGVRPLAEEQPMVNSHFYEMFLAWQRFMQLWATQFRSDFTFTFMPEVYPGGIVAFLQHGIQMYVEEVVHDFDYEAGFTTTASLSAPAGLGLGNAPSGGMIKALMTPAEAKDVANLPPGI